jgi:hypothetical protein
MEKSQAINLIEKLFDKKFDEILFVQFCSNLLNDFDTAKATTVQTGNYVYEPYRNHIKSFKRVGQYIDHEGELVDILTVKVHEGYKLERTRTGLRNFAIEYLKRKEDRDTLLIAFYSDDCNDWRLSYVKLEYKTFKDEKGKIKARQEATSARRYSFLVGETEPCHTAKKQFLPLLTETDENPTIQDIEKCFNIEKVTREFFEQYKILYLNLLEKLDTLVSKDKDIKKDFESKNIDAASFAKKLLGQIVFLYFIQKKGWLGVPKDKCFGKGDKRFLKTLFDKAEKTKENYFNNYLEHLFYEALAVQRTSVDPSYYKKFDCRIPFLNGGLFEPMKDYDWKNTEFILPNEIFSNTEVTKEGDIGTGVLDVFDRYNFTVKEDEPLEKEVAVDPEMLGKVFENLLEVKDRKSKGAFYTPREIVHYMCQESLINYLDTTLNSCIASHEEIDKKQTDLFGNKVREGQLKIEIEHKDIKIPKEDIEEFIKNSHLVIPDERKEKHSYQLPESIQIHSTLFDKALADIKVCDPAIGSGAFPVGMLNEIVKARTALTPYMGKKESDEDRTQYHLKRECIQNSLYGVDIDDSAIDVAKLRLWLSLVVDEETIQDIEPLPNLDYKIVCGNSLLGLPTGVMHNDGLEKEIEELKKEFFSQTDGKQKRKLKSLINDKFHEIISSMRNFTKDIPDILFDFQIHFSEVWHEKGGFDVVIGNPPYVRVQELPHNEIDHYKKTWRTAYKRLDISSLFFELATTIIKSGGNCSFISSNQFLVTEYGRKLREYFLNGFQFYQVIDFGDLPVFDQQLTYVGIFFFGCTKDRLIRFSKVEGLPFLAEILSFSIIKLSDLDANPWSLTGGEERRILNKVHRAKNKLSDFCKCNYGIVTGADEIFLFDAKKSIDDLPVNDSMLLPIIRASDIHKFKQATFSKKVLYPYKLIGNKTSLLELNDLKKDYRKTYNYLEERKMSLLKRKDSRHDFSDKEHWYGLTRFGQLETFKSAKIVFPGENKESRFGIDNLGYGYSGARVFSITNNDDIDMYYVLGVINSKTIEFYLHSIAPLKQGGYYSYSSTLIDQIPINRNTKEQCISQLVNYCINHDKSLKQETEIDARVAHLYNLSESEYQLILEGTEDTFRITALNYFREIQKGILK